MFTSRKKIHKDNNAEPTEFEESVAQVSYAAVFLLSSHLIVTILSFDHELLSLQAVIELESNSDLKSDLKDLYINSAV